MIGGIIAGIIILGVALTIAISMYSYYTVETRKSRSIALAEIATRDAVALAEIAARDAASARDHELKMNELQLESQIYENGDPDAIRELTLRAEERRVARLDQR